MSTVIDAIKISDQQAETYLRGVKILVDGGVPEHVAAPYIVMVKGYDDDWENYSELNLDDLENDNVIDAGYEDYQLWLNDTLHNLVDKGAL